MRAAVVPLALSLLPSSDPIEEIIAPLPADVTAEPPSRLTRSSAPLVEPFAATAVAPALNVRRDVCVRRVARREVLFAKRFTGKGSRRPRRKTKWSYVQC